MYLDYTDGPKNIDQIVDLWKKREPIEVLVEFKREHVRKLEKKDEYRTGRIYRLYLDFDNFETVGLEKCILNVDLATTRSDNHHLVGFRYQVVCDLTDGTGFIKARKVY